MSGARDAHWQAAWAAADLARARSVPGRRKFFAVVAYPGTSGFLHVGHLRGYAYADALHRYHRMNGAQVFLPFGIHASGLPAVTWAQKVREGDPTILAQLADHGVPPETIAGLGEPEAAARFLGHEYQRVLGRLGILFDPASYVTTIDDDYRAFIRWQFTALREIGALVQGSYLTAVCPVCGPVAVDPSETDLSAGGDAETIRFTAVPFPLDDGRILLAATLRPETVFGVTNLWLAPGGRLVAWHLGERTYLLAPDGAERMVEQHGGHLGHEVAAADLLGRTVRVPLAEHVVPIRASPLVDPALGTGVVMSVPAHAPADAAALRSLPAHEREALGAPRVILGLGPEALSATEEALTRGDGTPAERALGAVGDPGLEDRAALDEATERLYRLELLHGRLQVPGFEGVPVREARETIAADLRARHGGFELQEFSKPVVCRNGHRVVIRRVPNQWFLHYADPAWKAATHRRVDRLATFPPEYRSELHAIVDWFADRPCTRRGRWLGTPFPFEPGWVVEPIADSTFYMASFVVRRFVRDGRLRTEDLTPAFFDRVFRGNGPGEPRVADALQAEIRREFQYWYPLDLNIGGKEHKRVHFPVFLFTHAVLAEEALQPAGILVHGWITGPSGEKLSKKETAAKGGRIPPIDDGLERWGADALRLYYLLAVSPAQDLEFDPAAVDAAADRIADVARLAREAIGGGDGPPELDAWLLARTREWVDRAHRAFATNDLRRAAELLYVEVPALLRRYYARGGVPGAATERLARAWTRFLAPITPHTAEEIAAPWGEGLVAAAALPTAEAFPASPEAEAREAYLEGVEADLRAVLRAGEGRAAAAPTRVFFYVAAPWKKVVEGWAREQIARGEGIGIREAMARLGSHPELAAHRGELPRYLERVAGALRTEGGPGPAPSDEVDALRAGAGYLALRFALTEVAVHPEAEAEPFDPKGRRERARPGRPAFYFF